MLTQLTPKTLRQFRAVFYQLASHYAHAVLLDSCGWQGATGGLYVMGFDARQVVSLQGGLLQKPQGGVRVNTPEELRRQLAAYLPVEPTENAAETWESTWFGSLGYGLAGYLEPAVAGLQSAEGLGDLYLMQCRHVVVWQPEEGLFQIITADAAVRQQLEWLFQDEVLADVWDDVGAFERLALADAQASLEPEAFARRVEALKTQIQNGELYQANLSVRFSHETVMSPVQGCQLYDTLVRQNPSPFSGMLITPVGMIISNSPERLVKSDVQTGRVETRPIAGTRGRGKTADDEARIDAVLNTDPKEQAEHLMLLDLERNDLGRVCVAGSVAVAECAVLEKYSHVTHVVSQVEGQQRDDASAWDVLAAMFPGGTITGCPKIRCMLSLDVLEPVPRGLYTGSMGYLKGSGTLDFNILIRSLFYTPGESAGRLDYHAGAGIVADSVPAWEYRECLRKAEAIRGVLHDDHHPIRVH